MFIADTVDIIGAIFNFAADTVYVCNRSTDTLMAPGNFGLYQWNTNETTKYKLVSQAGKYTVSANTSDGCTVEDSIWVRIHPLPVIDLVGSDKVRLCGSYANTINLQVPAKLEKVKWSTGETSHTLFVSLINDKTTRHIRVSAADSVTGCVGGDTLSIYACDPGEFAKNIPSVITPNGDGANDTWNIKDLVDYDSNKKCIIEIYDRWGRIVFQSPKGYPKPWDGRVNGKLLPADAYFYILDLNNNSEPLTGTITILR